METELNALVGDWEISGSHPQFGDMALGRMSFEWMVGEKFLIQRWESDLDPFPSGLAVIGPGDTPGTYRQHYFDSRGVQRTYEMTMDGRVWTLERRDDDFWQRYRGQVGADEITGAWEKTDPGGEWELDFAITYTRKRR